MKYPLHHTSEGSGIVHEQNTKPRDSLRCDGDVDGRMVRRHAAFLIAVMAKEGESTNVL
ncbi:MAG: hypothetical protein AB7G68_14955 [Nitrospiraceae bacterium]